MVNRASTSFLNIRTVTRTPGKTGQRKVESWASVKMKRAPSQPWQKGGQHSDERLKVQMRFTDS